MKVATVYVRFYRAFNFDYLRKHHASSVPDPWDDYRDMFYPYVQIELDREITCIVGANESGKSQLLDAVEHALGSLKPDSADFCRYSEFFTVDTNPSVPHFGLRLTDLSSADLEALGAWSIPLVGSVTEVRIFRTKRDSLDVYVGDASEPVVVDLGVAREALPNSFRIDTRRSVPDSVPLDYLARKGGDDVRRIPGRQERWSIVDPLVANIDGLRNAIATALGNPDVLGGLLPPAESLSTLSDGERLEQEEEFQLAYDLLVTVGGVDQVTFSQLSEALRREDEGFANGIVAAINRQLSEALNLHRWWTQDVKFDLQVAARDFDLVFTIKDRTASEYSFAERSSGLKYFLSYLVQYLARLARGEATGLLLMDEPDAYLSNQGQQDLLRLFHDFAARSDDASPRQVVFVTHSPFLIDKNRADRVRVLDKGGDDEGTRVVHNAARNHFEPLRSAFGGFVGETTFIGNCNLMLEGVSDQVYIAGVSSALLRDKTVEAERLDLNEITLVPAGSASHIPYMTFLARGRDVDQPAVIVLLDGDKAGNDALKDLKSRGPRGRQILDPQFVLQIGPESLPEIESDRPDGPVDIEDLIPAEVLVLACALYAAEVDLPDEPLPMADDIIKHATNKVGLVAATQVALKEAGSALRLDKVGLARHTVRVIDTQEGAAVDRAKNNFRRLFTKLGEIQRMAVQERSRVEVGTRVDRVVASFLKDHAKSATRSDLKLLLEKVDALLDTSREAEEIRKQVRILRTEQSLDTDLSTKLDDYEALRNTLAGVKYVGVFASQDDGPDDAGS